MLSAKLIMNKQCLRKDYCFQAPRTVSICVSWVILEKIFHALKYLASLQTLSTHADTIVFKPLTKNQVEIKQQFHLVLISVLLGPFLFTFFQKWNKKLNLYFMSSLSTAKKNIIKKHCFWRKKQTEKSN